MVAEEMPDPVRTEFRLMHDKQNFGMPLAEAMTSFAERMSILDARFFVTAVLTQRESGGNLSEVLDSLAAIIRDRFRLRRQVRALSAHGRITGLVLFCLAPDAGGPADADCTGPHVDSVHRSHRAANRRPHGLCCRRSASTPCGASSTSRSRGPAC